jgi:hypothetical protein
MAEYMAEFNLILLLYSLSCLTVHSLIYPIYQYIMHYILSLI